VLISRPRSEERDGRVRVSAEVRWEDARRRDQILWYEVEARHAEALEPAPEAFALACAPAAQWLGEARLRVDAPLCAELHHGLGAMAELFRVWFDLAPLRVEAAGGLSVRTPEAGAGTASFLSGGLDALALLRGNRDTYPLDHPGSIRTCLLLYGTHPLEQDARGPVPERLAAFERTCERLGGLARAEHFELVPVYTNLRTLSPSLAFWMDAGYGAAIASAAHLLGRRVRTALLASDGAGMGAIPAGSHPMLDLLFSSAAVEIRHGQPALDRMQKVRLIAGWDAGLAVLQTCHLFDLPPDGALNCGRCEKCVRTRLSLLVNGALERATCFAGRDVRPEEIHDLWLPTRAKARHLRLHLPDLRELGRHDLADAIERKVAREDRRRARRERRQRWRRLRTRLGLRAPA